MQLSEAELKSFESNGFLIVKSFWHADFLKEVEVELQLLGESTIGKNFNFETFDRDGCTEEEQSLFYNRLKYTPILSRMSGSKEITALCNALGMQHPHLMGCCNMRMDKPNGKHLFKWHQDTLYLLGSINAVTIWYPIRGVTDLHFGTIQVIPSSHKKGILPFKKISNKPIHPYVPFLQQDLALDMEIKDKPIHIKVRKGDIVVFKQMLLHRSTQNFSDKIRWTGQIRVTDLNDGQYKKQGFPTGDKTNIFHVDYPGFKYIK